MSTITKENNNLNQLIGCESPEIKIASVSHATRKINRIILYTYGFLSNICHRLNCQVISNDSASTYKLLFSAL